MMRTLGVALLLALSILVLSPGIAEPLRAQVVPNARWQTFDTEHFRVHFHHGLEELARRAADRAEVARSALVDSMIEPPRGKIDLVIADNVDLSNGYATPFPTNRIVIYAHPPVGLPSLAFYDEWLELVLTHELVHIFHLDYAAGPYRWVRRAFGRTPFAFPNLFAPGWVTEGLATYLESRLTGAGRVRGTLHDMALRTAILEGEFFSIDRASGPPESWPGNATDYVYGSLFMAHLAERYGAEAVNEFVRRVGRRVVPYRLDAAARATFGISFTRAWSEWRAELERAYGSQLDSLRGAGATQPEVLTRTGRRAEHPRFSPDGSLIAYAAATGRDEPALRTVNAAGEETVVARLNTLGAPSWRRDGGGWVVAQLEREGPYRLVSDLYEIDAGGSDHRRTRAARLTQPDLHPAGRRVVAIRTGGGTAVPVLLDSLGAEPRALATSTPDVQWALPRWSPDGARIAIVRWRLGARRDVVVIDTSGVVVRELTGDRAIDDAPVWSPDGRHIVFSSDRTGVSNLYAYDLASSRLFQVTNVLTGAFQPDVSPDTRWIAFTLYRADGYHVARIPFAPEQWRPAAPVRSGVEGAADGVERYSRTAGGPRRPFSPWPSLKPAAWSPILTQNDALGIGVGAAVGGVDVIGRHSYGAEAQVRTDGGRVDAAANYGFRGLGNPVTGFSASQTWSVRAESGTLRTRDGTLAESALLERTRTIAARATLLRPRWQSFAALTGAVSLRQIDRVWDEADAAGVDAFRIGDVPLDLGGLAAASYSSAGGYDFSISPEDGISASLVGEGRRFLAAREGESRPAGYLRVTGRSHGYRGLRGPGFARHVAALRANVGADVGARSPGFAIGGTGSTSSSLPLGNGLDLGEHLDFPLRGYARGVQQGDRALSTTLEYRLPLRLVERGYRLVPVFLDRIWGDVFADAATAWCVAECEVVPGRVSPSPRLLYSVGAELATALSLGYFSGLTLRGGVAVPLVPVERSAGVFHTPPVRPFFAFGRSF